ncbi:hypothetical protein [Cumulibacter soli]|uniref:hypothetical protein n=1 Tax=Cumulibacter soli TaxID=2546344 RepID=UPI0010671F57|nr:hypothetical protein [Cumulibacter soli]
MTDHYQKAQELALVDAQPATVHALLAIAGALQSPQTVDIMGDRATLQNGDMITRDSGEGTWGIEYNSESVWFHAPGLDEPVYLGGDADALAGASRFLADAAHTIHLAGDDL